MARKKKHKRQHAGVRRLPARLRQELKQIEQWMERGDIEEARGRLRSLQLRYPQYPEVWEMAVALEPDNPTTVLQATERLLALNPNDELAAYNRLIASLHLLGPFLVHEWGQAFLRKWPNSRFASKIADLVEALPRAMEESIALVRQDLPHLSEEQAKEVMRLHELVRYHIALDQYDKAVAAARTLLQLEPRFAPGVNNLALVYAKQKEHERALQMLMQAYEDGVKNAYTLAFLVEMLYVLEREDDLQRFTEVLKDTPAATVDHAHQKMVAWALLGEDERVLETFEEAKKARDFANDHTGLVGAVHHLAATAYLRLGQEHQARKAWKQAVRHGSEEAQTCLQDFGLPPEQRHIPWYFEVFDLPMFFDESDIRALERTLEEALRKKGEAVRRALRRQLQRLPYLPRLFAVWLDRGGPTARTLALQFLMVVDDPQYYPILAAFGQSTRGPDNLRMEAIRFLLERRYFSGPSVKVWQHGKWQDLNPEIMDIEIVDIPQDKYSWDLQVLTDEGYFAISRNEYRRAEFLFRAALPFMPKDTTIRHNLAVALLYQGRQEEALTLLKTLHRERPEYVFARVTLAELALMEGDVEQAQAWLGTLKEDPWRNKKRWHISEYVAFVQAMALLLTARGERENALGLLEDLEDLLTYEFDRPNLRSQTITLQKYIHSGLSAQEIAKRMLQPLPSRDQKRLALLEGTPLQIGQRVRVLSDSEAETGARRTGWLVDVEPGRFGRSPRVRVVWDANTMRRLGKPPDKLKPEEEEAHKRGTWVSIEEVEPLEAG